MFQKAGSGRDAFTFSLRGMRTIASFTVVPAIADDHINRTIDQRRGPARQDQPSLVHEIEDFFARYFAPGCCQAA